MYKSFSLDRVIAHIKRDVFLLKGTAITGMCIAIGVLFLLLLFNFVWDKEISPNEFSSAFGFIYFVLGIVLTFAIFKELHNQKANQLYLSLPISPLERLIATWLTVVIVYTILFSLVGFVIGEFAILFSHLFQASEQIPLVPFTEGYWRTIKAYLFLQPLFMFGAITFKKNRAGKTILCLVLTIIFFAIFNMMLYGLFNFNFDVFNGGPLASEASDRARSDFSTFGQWLLMIVVGPIMVLATYFKLKEKEVR